MLCSVGCYGRVDCLVGVRGVQLSLALVIFSYFHQTELPTSRNPNNSLASSERSDFPTPRGYEQAVHPHGDPRG